MRRSSFIIFLFFWLSTSVFACTCVHKKIKAKGFNGQVIYVTNSSSNIKEPISKATIRLLKQTDGGYKVITEVLTDKDGRFDIADIKGGTYILEAVAENSQKLWTKIKISKASIRNKDKLEIALDPSLNCCKGYAKVQRQT